VTIALLIGSSSAWQAELRTRDGPLLRLRGGKLLTPNPVTQAPARSEQWSLGDSKIKLVHHWSGDVADLAIGLAIGGSCGFLCGRWARWVLRTLTESVIGVPVFVASHVAFVGATNAMLLSANLIKINWAVLTQRFGGRIRPIARRFDADGDGSLTWNDLEILISRLLGHRVGRWFTDLLRKSGVDQDGDGRFTRKDVSLFLQGNDHGSLGLQAGAAAGLAAGSLTSPLRFQQLFGQLRATISWTVVETCFVGRWAACKCLGLVRRFVDVQAREGRAFI
jgi:hypothetical protein